MLCELRAGAALRRSSFRSSYCVARGEVPEVEARTMDEEGGVGWGLELLVPRQHV